VSLHATASQTVGPFFHIGMEKLLISDIAGPGAKGERLSIQGRVLDGDGKPVPDAILEFWQANAVGKYAHPADAQSKPVDPKFNGFGRVATGADGSFSVSTIKPGAAPGAQGAMQAPHIAVSIFMRGMLKRAVSRIYFPGEAANANDPVLLLVPADRRTTLIAKQLAGKTGVLEWNVVVQGEGESVFFDC
jgi:protocatechuate 3,4-dioxygenase alpha subunit